MQRFLLHTYTSIPEVYIILLLRDLKTKKVRHQHPHPHPHLQNKKIISVPTTKILIKYKRIKWTPSRKASQLLPGGQNKTKTSFFYKNKPKTRDFTEK